EVARELNAFVSVFQQGAGLVQDFQVGVVTTSVYQNALFGGNLVYQDYPTQSGKLQPVPSSGDRILSGDDPDLIPKFAELVQLGPGGGGEEPALEAARLALTPPLSTQPIDQGGNEGFLRPGARLLVVVVGDEDDCSELPPRPPKVSIGTDPA